MKCAVCGASREAFADDRLWFDHVRYCLAHPPSMAAPAPTTLPTAPHVALEQARALRKARDLAQHREWLRQHREEVRAYNKNYYALHSGEAAASVREWRRRHPGAHAEHERARRERNPDYAPQEIHSLQARDLESIVCELRQEGRTFKEIAHLTGKNFGTCFSAYQRARPRAGTTLREAARLTQRQQDALVLATYTAGMTFRELAQRLGYAHAVTARTAYVAAARRANKKPEKKREPHPIDEERVLALAEQGMSFKKIARQLGCSDTGVGQAYYRALDRATRPNQPARGR
jgi:cyanate lyase